MGAVLANNNVAETFEPGDHAATFGGSPLACVAAMASINYIIDKDLLKKSRENGNYFMEKLEQLKEQCGVIKEIRGIGLMIGMEIKIECSKLVDSLRENGVIVNCAAGNVLRFVPPLVITKSQIDTVICSLEDVLSDQN